MKDQTIPIDAVKTLITETIKQVSLATDKRQDSHEERTREQMAQVTKAIDRMADTVAESTKINAKMQAETNKQLAAGHAQFMKWEERHINQLEKHDDLRDQHRALKGDVQELKNEQIADTLTRRVTWKVGVIVLTGVMGGAFTFAWWMAKTITSALLTATIGTPTP